MPPLHVIWHVHVIRILYPDRNPDHPHNLINCSLARNTPGESFMQIRSLLFLVIRGTD